MAPASVAPVPAAFDEAAARRALVARLRRIEGQLRGVQAMIAAGEECEPVAQQLSAARKALDKAFFELIACAIERPQGGCDGPRDVQHARRIARALARFG